MAILGNFRVAKLECVNYFRVQWKNELGQRAQLMTMNILYHPASVFKSWDDLKLKCELEWPYLQLCCHADTRWEVQSADTGQRNIPIFGVSTNSDLQYIRSQCCNSISTWIIGAILSQPHTMHGISRALCCSMTKKKMLQKIVSIFSRFFQTWGSWQGRKTKLPVWSWSAMRTPPDC